MVRYVLGVLLGIAALVVLFGERGDLMAARHQFRHSAGIGYQARRRSVTTGTAAGPLADG